MSDEQEKKAGCTHENCTEQPMIFLNGQILLCWTHYCEAMKPVPALSAVRDAAKEGERPKEKRCDEGQHVYCSASGTKRYAASMEAKVAALRAEITKLSTRLDDSQASETKVVEELAKLREELTQAHLTNQQLKLMYVMVDTDLPEEFEPDMGQGERVSAFAKQHESLKAALARERERHREMEVVARAFIEAVTATEKFVNNAIGIATIHGFPYAGPNYAEEQVALRSLLPVAPAQPLDKEG